LSYFTPFTLKVFGAKNNTLLTFSVSSIWMQDSKSRKCIIFKDHGTRWKANWFMQMNSGNSLRVCTNYTLKTTRNFPFINFNLILKKSPDFVRSSQVAESIE